MKTAMPGDAQRVGAADGASAQPCGSGWWFRGPRAVHFPGRKDERAGKSSVRGEGSVCPHQMSSRGGQAEACPSNQDNQTLRS